MLRFIILLHVCITVLLSNILSYQIAICNLFVSFLFAIASNTIRDVNSHPESLKGLELSLEGKIPGMDNWERFARNFGVSKDCCDYLKKKEMRSPTVDLLTHLYRDRPNLKGKDLIEALIQIQRRDVLSALKKFFSGRV